MYPRARPQQRHSVELDRTLPVRSGAAWYRNCGSASITVPRRHVASAEHRDQRRTTLCVLLLPAAASLVGLSRSRTAGSCEQKSHEEIRLPRDLELSADCRLRTGARNPPGDVAQLLVPGRGIETEREGGVATGAGGL